MARGQYRHSKELRALEALIAVAHNPKASVGALAKAGRAYLLPGARQAFERLTPLQEAALKRDLREFLADMAHQPGVAASKEHHLSVDLVLAGGAGLRDVVQFLGGSPRDVLLYQAFTFLQAVGLDQLRRCPAPDCGRAFVKRGRREYCSTRCQRRVFLSNYNPFAAQPQRKDGQRATKTRKG
jgi:hypothetical protein